MNTFYRPTVTASLFFDIFLFITELIAVFINLCPFHALKGRTPRLPASVLSKEELGGESIYHLETRFGKVNVKTPTCWNTLPPQVDLAFDRSDAMLFGKDGSRMGVTGDEVQALENMLVS